MSDRTSFLNSIREAPDDDVARLVYADWLDDNGESDCDTATAQFIRLGCSLDVKKKRQTREEGAFLDESWQRLVPKLAADGFALHRRKGRQLAFTREDDFAPKSPLPTIGRMRTFTRWCLIDFWRGFAVHIATYQPRDLFAVVQSARTQPLATLMCDVFLLGHENRFTEISSRHFRRQMVLANDIFERIEGYDVLVTADHAELIDAELPFAVKRFNRKGCAKRAAKSLSDAIRSFVDSAPALA